MQDYTLAFIFNHDCSKILLIHKKFPEWQRGKINGLGGKVEVGESFLECVSREVKEESSLTIPLSTWKKIGQLNSVKWHTQIFAYSYQGVETNAQSLESQQVEWFPVSDLPKNCMSNLFWLIPLCADFLQHEQIKEINVVYNLT